MTFAILRTAKLKGRAALIGRAAHHLRSHPVPNADSTRSNVTSWKGTARQLADEVLRRTEPLMRRKDAVQAIEVLLTASPEWWSQHGGAGEPRDFARVAKTWLTEQFGAGNVVAVGMHMDERTPHVWAVVTPITPDGRLAASTWLDGPRRMSAMQDSWAAAARPLGLVRGVERASGSHISTRLFYAAAGGAPGAVAAIEREMRTRAKRAREKAEEAERRAEEITAAKAEVARQRAEVRALFDALSPADQAAAADRYRPPPVPAQAAESKPERPPSGSPGPRPPGRR